MFLFLSRDCGKICQSSVHLEKHRLSHAIQDITNSDEIDIDLTQDDNDDDIAASLNDTGGQDCSAEIYTRGLQDKPETFESCGYDSEVQGHSSKSDRIEGKDGVFIPSKNQRAQTIKLEKRHSQTKSPKLEYCKPIKSEKWQPKAKKLKCSYCEKGFYRTQHLNEHLLTHTREKPHKCEFCRKKYRLKSHLNRHMQNCH